MHNSEFKCNLSCAYDRPCFFEHGVHNISFYIYVFFDGSGWLHSAKLPLIEKVVVMTDEYPDSFSGETSLSPHMQTLHITNIYESWEDLCRTLEIAWGSVPHWAIASIMKECMVHALAEKSMANHD